MAGTPKKSTKATGKAKKAAIKANRTIKQTKHKEDDRHPTPRPTPE
ncbi:hypothetical protein [Sphaerisporangium aureirubrum]|uniref:Uncharacterized protein n=1 Tax=Sphaerisporangium aureirubrum TaxID=1544736 RepID=A0ABW1NR73_9ACTN